MAQKGNTNFFRTFKGRFLLVPAPPQSCDTNVVMLSCTNDVQPIGDWDLTEYVGGTPFGTLPEECCPGKVVKIPVVVEADGNETTEVLTITEDGSMRLGSDIASGKLYLSGMNFNISDNWY